ncbi:MAG: hypothetical protein RSE38_12775 [Acinetobacter sp.]
MIDFEHLTNPEKYHTVAPRIEGEKDEQYKARLGAYVQGVESQQAKIDELQARIDATEKWIESNKKNIPLSEWHGYTTEEYVDADDLLDILKGNKDEN